MGKVRKGFSKIKDIAGRLLKRFKALSLKKKIVVIILGIIILSFVSNALGGSQKPEYSLEKASIGDITEIVSETGAIATNGRTDVFSPTIGIVDTVLVENGEGVIRGQELFTVISSATEQEKQAAYSGYLTAKTALDAVTSLSHSLRSAMYTNWDLYYDLSTGDNYENSDGSPRKDERLAAEFQVAQENWVAAEKKYKDQVTAVSQAQAQVNSAWLLYQATQNAVVKAPIDGVVSNLSVVEGRSVGIKLVGAQPVLILENQSVTEVVVSLTETDISKIKTGQDAVIKVDAIDDKDFEGTVTRFDEIGTDEQGVIRFKVYIRLSESDDNLKSGMGADVDITTKKISDTLTVPNSAVKPYKNGRAVRVVDKKTKEVKYIPVKIGVKGKDRTQILSGIKEGDEIIKSLSNEQLKRPGLLGT